ncbi:MAG TPA: CotH kinase family protein, partial [Candidatus Dormibacteraeota bacterium]|nr:CotH kinase family protein [Candidatus Dormibacteraeota bacterium]
SAPCDYKFDFPKDDPFLNGDEATLCWPGLAQNPGVDNTAQGEQTCYWLAGRLALPFNYRRYASFFLNGTQRSFIMEDTQKPDDDILKQWFPTEPAGDLYKLSIWREFANDSQNHTTIAGAQLANYISGGVKKTARYRWNWQPRAFQGTANSFSNLFALADLVNTTNNYTASIEAGLDIDQWMRMFAVEHIVANWDSYGYGNGQNMYAYKPVGGKWKMIPWDMDASLGNLSDPTTADLFKLSFLTLNGDVAVVGRMYNNVTFRRAAWRAYKEAVNGPLLSTNVNTLLDAKYAAFQANGIAAASPSNLKSWLASRRSYIVGQLASVAVNFAITSNGGNDFSTATNPVTLVGTAPVEITTIRINDIPVPFTCTTETNWSLSFLLQSQTNVLQFAGYDRYGSLVPGATDSITITFTGSSNLLLPTVFINEWMAENTSFIADPADGLYDDWFELYNPG